MSAHVLLNLLNELRDIIYHTLILAIILLKSFRKIDYMLGRLRILSLFSSSFDKFIKTRALM